MDESTGCISLGQLGTTTKPGQLSIFETGGAGLVLTDKTAQVAARI